MTPFDKFHLPDGFFGGRPTPTYANTKAILGQLVEGDFDEFTQSMAVRASFLGGLWRPLSDELYSATRQSLINEYGFDPGLMHIRNALRQLCWENRRDSLRDELLGLKCEGEDDENFNLISNFFTTHVGAEDSPLTRAKSRMFWRCVVGRPLNPGCVCDSMLVLVGPQGCGKTSMGRLIAGDPSRFMDQDVMGLTAREQQELLKGRWIAEAAELAEFMTMKSSRVKRFLSQTHDRARPAWGTATVDQPRRFFMYATTNEMEFFNDETGSRRFTILRTGRIDLDAIARDRPRLLAQAVKLQAMGRPLRMLKKHWPAIAAENERYFDEDPLKDVLAAVKGIRVKAEMRVAFDEVWAMVDVQPERRTKGMKHRLVRCMSRLGWEHDPGVMSINGRSVRSGFRKPTA